MVLVSQTRKGHRACEGVTCSHFSPEPICLVPNPLCSPSFLSVSLWWTWVARLPPARPCGRPTVGGTANRDALSRVLQPDPMGGLTEGAGQRSPGRPGRVGFQS